MTTGLEIDYEPTPSFPLIVATDGREQSDGAVRAGALLAGKSGAWRVITVASMIPIVVPELDLRLTAPAVVDVVRLQADDRLDAVLLRGLVELHGAVHHAVIGQPQGGLPEVRGPLCELVDLARSVQQRVLGMDVEMGAAGSRHGLPRL